MVSNKIKLMSIGQDFLQELMLESVVTRRYLESVPFDKKDFKSAEKSETLGRLAIHVAEIVGWWDACITQEKLDFIDFVPKDIVNTEDLLEYFECLLTKAKLALKNVTDDELNEEWSMTYGEDTLFTLPKKQVLRIFCMNHLIHHRAQLGVYLRMLDVPVPAGYGPSADDDNVTLINRYMN
jgi:uncharacterized damage-inducible protein DinB